VDGETSGKLKNLISRGRRGSTSSRRNSRIRDDTTNPQADPEKVPETKKSAVPPPIITTQPSTPTRDLFGGPTTVVTPPTPTGTREEDQSTPTPKAKKDESSDSDRSGAKPATASPQSQSHSRTKSGGSGPSKLSNAISLPLTPALEEVNTPGGTLVAPSSTTGFFSSMFSAAQSAASSISNTISLPASAKLTKGSAAVVGESETASALGAESAESDDATGDHAVGQNQKRQLAVETLGSGNLSLSHLGITDSKETRPMSSRTDGPELPQVAALRKDEGAPKTEDDSTARAVSVAYSEKTNGEKSVPPSVISAPSDQFKVAHPDEQTPVKSLQEPENGSIRRAGSVRSRLSGSRRRRTRGSSGTTATTATVQANGVQRPQGFAVANPKRNRDFHNLFKSVPDDDLLIEDYSAALQREILLHGRLYVSEGHICFSSNILGWVTNLVISFDEVISVEKKSTAVIFQNGIVISTMHARNVFASLLNRDATYELIISMWKITHPNLRSTLNGNAVEGGGTGDKTEKAESVADGDSASEELYDEDETTEDDGDGNKSMEAVGNESITGSDAGEAVKAVSRKVSAAVGGAVSNGIAKVVETAEPAIAGAAVTIDFPGPPTHETTDCGDGPNHHEKPLMDATIPAPLGKIYTLMFGPASGTFMRKWLTEDQKSLNVQLEDDKKGLGPDKKEMSYSYIKPLGGSGFAPKQTTCIINMTLEQFDLEKAVTVACSTQNPDVPSGNSFTVKTRYCLMWGPSNSTRLIMNYTIEWTNKSWLKGTCWETHPVHIFHGCTVLIQVQDPSKRVQQRDSCNTLKTLSPPSKLLSVLNLLSNRESKVKFVGQSEGTRPATLGLRRRIRNWLGRQVPSQDNRAGASLSLFTAQLELLLPLVFYLLSSHICSGDSLGYHTADFQTPIEVLGMSEFGQVKRTNYGRGLRNEWAWRTLRPLSSLRGSKKRAEKIASLNEVQKTCSASYPTKR